MTQTLSDTTTAAAVEVLPVALHIGAEVSGVQARARPRPGRAWPGCDRPCCGTRWSSLRDQHDLDDAGPAGLRRPARHPDHAAPDGGAARAGVLPIDSEYGKANSWHTDVTFVDRVPAISVLRAIDPARRTAAPRCGPTRSRLRPACTRRCRPWPTGSGRCTPTSTTTPPTATSSGSAGSTSRSRRTARSSATWSTRPSTRVVRVHPETGERAAAARPLRQALRRPEQPGLEPTCSPCCSGTSPSWRTPCAGAGAGRHRDLGQPGHPALRAWTTTATSRACCTG